MLNFYSNFQALLRLRVKISHVRITSEVINMPYRAKGQNNPCPKETFSFLTGIVIHVRCRHVLHALHVYIIHYYNKLHVLHGLYIHLHTAYSASTFI